MADNVVQFANRAPEPGDVADADGNLWIDVGLRKLTRGQGCVTTRQAEIAKRFGWAILPDTELNDRVVVERGGALPTVEFERRAGSADAAK